MSLRTIALAPVLCALGVVIAARRTICLLAYAFFSVFYAIGKDATISDVIGSWVDRREKREKEAAK